MAQTGFTPISNYYSSTATNVPTAGNLVAGELAINTADGVLYYKDSSGVVQSIASKAGNSGSFTNLAYTGTFTGGTGVVNLGSGQFYKDASGNVGIGTSSPAQKLDVVDGRIRTAGSTGNSGYIQIFNNANTTGQLQLGQGLASGTDNVGYLWNIANASLSFGTNNTEAMRIDSSGNLLVGTTSTALNARLLVKGSTLTSTDACATFQNSNNSELFSIYEAGNVRAQYIGSAVGTALVLDSNGYIQKLTSSIRYKKDVEPIDIGLDFILGLNPVKYNLKESNEAQVGFIAEDFPDPRLTSMSKIDIEDESKGYQVESVNYAQIVAPLVKAIQEQQALIESLTTRLTVLEAK